jgi:predicted metal-dependent hydrolase
LPVPKPDYRTYFLAGVAHFNAHEFWEAHEAWETIWLAAGSDVEQFLQGLIQLAAAYHHVKRGTHRGAVRLFEAALRRLSAFPPRWSGIDRAAAEEAARRHQGRISVSGEAVPAGEYPELVLLAEDESPIPPREEW